MEVAVHSLAQSVTERDRAGPMWLVGLCLLRVGSGPRGVPLCAVGSDARLSRVQVAVALHAVCLARTGWGRLTESAYESLLHKYPSSLAVLQGYSHFCDTVLNDNLRAKELREKALAEEGVSGTANAAEDSGRSVEDGIPSSQSSASDSASLRTRAGRAVGKWISEVMAAEREVVVKLQRRER
eukprot:1241892-Rhodomonas_salina.1